jgi:chorismate mutase
VSSCEIRIKDEASIIEGLQSRFTTAREERLACSDRVAKTRLNSTKSRRDAEVANKRLEKLRNAVSGLFKLFFVYLGNI